MRGPPQKLTTQRQKSFELVINASQACLLCKDSNLLLEMLHISLTCTAVSHRPGIFNKGLSVSVKILTVKLMTGKRIFVN